MWCPVCRNEYKEGITECADCHVALVEELPPEEEKIPDQLDDGFAKWAMEHADLLEKVKEAEQVKKTKAEIAASLLEKEEGERTVDLDDVGSDIDMVEAAAALAKANASTGAYRSADEKAKEFHSSAWTLLIVGGGGLIAMILIMTGILPFHFASNIKFLSYGVMSLLFLIFIVVGIKSFGSAKKYAKEAEIERVLTEDIRKWFFESFTKESIDEDTFSGDEESMIEIEKYYKRIENIKAKIQSKFTSLDEAYLDKIADDFFHEIFE